MYLKVIIDAHLAESLWRLPARSRREIIDIFEKLALHPLAAVEDQIRATDGRMIYRAKFNRWRICFWIDGPVNELRIVEVSRAR
ncbi:MAG: hypothetical protein RIS79_1335 [Verrucomicrobiota bacterium]|jgi:mRNA-degrading endonuclease RelE of RelBE toxin-antitoxin system